MTIQTLVVGSLLMIAGCDQETDSEQVHIFAAASTTEAVEELCQRFESETSYSTRSHFASSATLANQIVNGADADLFLSANLEWADALKARGKVRSWEKAIGNRLVLVGLTGKPESWSPKTLTDLMDDRVERIALADPESVPAGIYAKRAMQNAGVWEAIQDKLVYGANVRQSLMMIETAAVDFGIVYQSDAAISEVFEIEFEIAEQLSGPIFYAVALTRDGEEKLAATRFFEFVRSANARQILVNHGFIDFEPEK